MNVSVIGIGNLGAALASALLSAGYRVTVYNRTRSKAERLRTRGAQIVNTASEAIRASSHTIVVLFDEKSTREVLLAKETRDALHDKALISAALMTSDECVALAKEVGATGGRLSEVNFITYPDKVEAREAEALLACVQSDKGAWHEIFGAFSRKGKVYDVGSVGNASKAQLSLILSYVFLTAAIANSLAAFEKLNLPVPVIQNILTDSPAVAIGDANKQIAEMSRREYGSGRWSINNMISTIDQAAEFAMALKMDTTAMTAIRQIYARAASMGYGTRDITSVYEAIYPRGPVQG